MAYLLRNSDLVRLLKDPTFSQSMPELGSVKIRKSGCGGCGAVGDINTMNAVRRLLIKLAERDDPRLQIIFRILGKKEPIRIIGYDSGRKIEATLEPAL